MASLNRILYWRGDTMVGPFPPPPNMPDSLTQLSNFLSQVNVRMKSVAITECISTQRVWTTTPTLLTNNAHHQFLAFFIYAHKQRIIHDISIRQKQCIVVQ